MKIKICWPMTYIDTSVWILYQEPETMVPTLFKATVNMRLVSGEGALDQLVRHLENEYGQPVYIEDLGIWDNVRNSDGTVSDPFNLEIVSK